MKIGYVKLSFVVTALVLINVNIAQCDNSNNFKKVDEYVLNQQSNCYQSKKLLSCFRYRIAKTIWSFSTGRMNLFAQENDLKGTGGIKMVQLAEPENTELFLEARENSGNFYYIYYIYHEFFSILNFNFSNEIFLCWLNLGLNFVPGI